MNFAITILLIVVAAASKAVADTLADHFDVSIFKNLNQKFWKKDVSCNYARKLPFTKYPVDAWHLAGSLMIVSLCVAIRVHHVSAVSKWYNEMIDIIFYGILFDVTFDVFYDHLLKKK